MAALEDFLHVDQLDVYNLRVTNTVVLSGGDLDMGGNRITNLGTPVAATDATTKAYVDGIAVGGTPAGADTQVQYNSGGVFAAEADFTWRTAGKILAVSGATPRLLVGSQAADAGAALQLRTDVGAAAVAVSAGPARQVYQSTASGIGAALTTIMTLTLTDRTAAYCEVVVSAVVTGAPSVGDVTVEHRRFTCTRDGGTSLSTVTTDHAVGGTGVLVETLVVGTDLVVRASSGTGGTYDYACAARLDITAAW